MKKLILGLLCMFLLLQFGYPLTRKAVEELRKELDNR